MILLKPTFEISLLLHRRVRRKNSWRNKLILRPDGKPRMTWDCAVLLIVTYSSFEACVLYIHKQSMFKYENLIPHRVTIIPFTSSRLPTNIHSSPLCQTITPFKRTDSLLAHLRRGKLRLGYVELRKLRLRHVLPRGYRRQLQHRLHGRYWHRHTRPFHDRPPVSQVGRHQRTELLEPNLILPTRAARAARPLSHTAWDCQGVVYLRRGVEHPAGPRHLPHQPQQRLVSARLQGLSPPQDVPVRAPCRRCCGGCQGAWCVPACLRACAVRCVCVPVHANGLGGGWVGWAGVGGWQADQGVEGAAAMAGDDGVAVLQVDDPRRQVLHRHHLLRPHPPPRATGLAACACAARWRRLARWGGGGRRADRRWWRHVKAGGGVCVGGGGGGRRTCAGARGCCWSR